MSAARGETGLRARPACVGTAALGRPSRAQPGSLPAIKATLDLRWAKCDPMIKRIATAVVLIPLVLLLVLKAPLYLMAIVAASIALLAVAEFLKLTTHYAVQPLTAATYAFVALFFVFVIIASTNRTPLVETAAILYGLAAGGSAGAFCVSDISYAPCRTCHRLSGGGRFGVCFRLYRSPDGAAG